MKNLTNPIVYEKPAVCEVSLANQHNQEAEANGTHYHNSSIPVQTKHLEEWMDKSGVREDIALSCLESLDDFSEIATRLGWKGYRHTPGWWVSGIDLKTGERSKFGQFKPDEPIFLSPEDDKPAKYITPKKEVVTYDALALPVRDWQEVIDDPSIGIVETEGAKKVGAGETCGYPTVGVVGVEMGLIKGKLVPNLEILAVQGRPWTFAFDSDILSKKEVQNALKKQASILKRRGVVVFVATWKPELGKGIDDVLANHGQEKVQEIMQNAVPYSTWLKNLEVQFEPPQAKTIPNGLPPAWDAGSLSTWLVDRYRQKLAWDVAIQEWRRYSSQIEGIWSIEPCEFVRQVIQAEITPLMPHYCTPKFQPKLSPGLIEAIEKLMKWNLAVRQWDEQTGMLPLLNGVLNLETYQLIPHAPGHRLTWCLPYQYNPLALCDPIQNWLLEMTQGDRALVQLLRAYLYGIVTSHTDWQKYLELVGPGGTGKSTFIRLALALVGQQNVHTTTLKKLENERFETASIKDKRLVVITDSERYTGNVSVLKALTGQDLLPYEQKFKQSTGGFTPTAMVIVAANEIIQSGDYTSGLERRRMTVPMTHRIEESEQRNLLEHRNGQIDGEFVPYLPGLLNWVLGMNPDEAKTLVKNYQTRVPSLTKMKAQSLVEINPIADWLDHAIVYRPELRTQVGVAKRDKTPDSENWFCHVSNWLYANYAEYSHNTGAKAVSVRRFVNLLNDLCVNQLKLNVRHGRDRQGAYFLGLQIRTDSDLDPLLITGDSDSPPPDGGGGGSHLNPPPPSPPSTLGGMVGLPTGVMDDDGTVMDSVMAETRMGDGCDGCDGLFQVAGSKKEQAKNDLTLLSPKSAINNGEMPSHPSHKIAETIAGDELQPIPQPAQNPSPIHHREGFEPSPKVPTSPPSGTAYKAETLDGDELQLTPSPLATDYTSYPHLTSNDLRAKEKRAKQCKELMLACSNQEQLSAVKQGFGFRESETQWVYNYALTPGEQEKVKEAAAIVQPSLLDQPEYNWDELISEIDDQMSRLGWSTGRGQQYLLDKYGVKSRKRLNNEQLIEFLEYLKNCSPETAMA